MILKLIFFAKIAKKTLSGKFPITSKEPLTMLQTVLIILLQKLFMFRVEFR